ncbi:hypothetical protein [Microlunatus soli]|uniref:DUF4019 domain-containing protein n=1 Tax=Microlunatus soli TaxID=630515 RepID=A0A1H1UGA0_9ACTN|nr:hypothetical protein [Microlunatus soli]SDS71545.1 hypothetical protein SAMN04489812_2777 [Microlunatus soli]
MMTASRLLVILVLLTLAAGCARGQSADDRSGERPSPIAAPSPAASAASAEGARPFPGGHPSRGSSGSGPAVADPRSTEPDAARGLTASQRRVDRRDADQVATAFVVRLEAWDTALDRRPNDAVRRAVAFADPVLRSRLLAAEPRSGPGARWNQLAEHRGWTSVRTRLGGLGPPPTTDRSAVRAVSVTPVDHGAGDWIAFPDTGSTYIVTLRRQSQDAGWTVVGYTIQ